MNAPVRTLLLLGLLVAPIPHALGANACIIRRFDLPVVMEGLRPVLTAQVNGANVRLLADSGAFFSMISPAAAAELKLTTHRGPDFFSVSGIGGRVVPDVATVTHFSLGGVDFRRVDFLVGGTEVGAGAAGLLGQNVMRLWDLEYDLANGMIRIVKPENCGNRPMAYWAAGTSQPFAVMELQSPTPQKPQPIGWARVNGKDVRVGLDTGASTSLLSLSAARRAGIAADSPGVKPAGSTIGIGRGAARAWIAPVDSFKIGDEEIRHTQLRVADVSLDGIDMLLGDDFFLSHHIYVANRQGKAYLTYNGGPVFRLDAEPRAPTAPAAPAAPAAEATTSATAGAGSAATPAPESAAAGTEPTGGLPDAASYIRRGTAYAARRDYVHALSDLTRACELAPANPDCFYELGRVYAQNRQRDLALQNIDKALELKHDHVFALLTRAELRLPARDAVRADLDTLDHVLARQDNARLPLGAMYDRIGEHSAAIHQYDLWIDTHGEDARLPTALNDACWARAEANQDLDRALKHCNRALRLRPDTAAYLDSRGLVYLRRGELDRAIADYDAALKLMPRNAASLYGRGLAKLRKGLDAQGRADLGAATEINHGIAERFADMGLKP